MPPVDPIRPTDDDARALARRLLGEVRFAALAVTDRETLAPTVSRIALIPGPDGTPLSLVSALSAHSANLRANPECALLVGEPGPTGDPLTHPRMTLDCTARFVASDDPDRPGLREHYLALVPKSKLYIDFADFAFVHFAVRAVSLNGGFGKAYHLDPEDLLS